MAGQREGPVRTPDHRLGAERPITGRGRSFYGPLGALPHRRLPPGQAGDVIFNDWD